MKKFILTSAFILLAAPAWATTYFLAPASGGGNDSNNGSSASTPWLTPNHSVNCGDVILAAASSAYVFSNFNFNWGTVSCPAGNNVAWLKCATFDTCKIIVDGGAGSDHGIAVNNSYWGVQGWEVTVTSGGACFDSYPNARSIHHIIFANNVCNGAQTGAFDSSANVGSGFSNDYWVAVGNIAYNAASASAHCNSGFDIFGPLASDTVAGTHYYIAGNFAWLNANPSTCQGGTSTDGEGIIFDTITSGPYSQQMVIYNNIFLSNGGAGIQDYENNGTNPAPIIAEYNTLWGNCTSTVHTAPSAEMWINTSMNTTYKFNLVVTSKATGCGGNTDYVFYAYNSNSGTNTIASNWGYSANGSNTGNSGGFSFGSNTFANPNLTSPSTPGAPSCGSTSSVPNCMAALIANFTPTTAAAKAYGYQVPSTSQVSDPLFPQWLCNVNLPPGLVTMGCLSTSSLPAPPTSINVTVE